MSVTDYTELEIEIDDDAVEFEIDTQLGTKSITDTLANNVENYQYAQVTDSNLVAENIRKDINVLGITGTYGNTPPTGTKQITDTSLNDVATYEYAQVVDSDLVASNIKKDVNILGVSGSYEGELNLIVETDASSEYYTFPRLGNATWNCKTLYVTINHDIPTIFYSQIFVSAKFPYCERIDVVFNVPPKCCRKMFFGINQNSTTINTLNLVGDFSQNTSYDSFFGYTNIENITGSPLDFTSVTSAIVDEMFYISTNLKEVRFVPNTLKVDMIVSYGSLSGFSNASFISLANSFNEESACTITNRAIKTKSPSILGTVSLDSTGTYHIFTEDSSGSTTLQDFIVNTKGWALA